MYCGFLFIRNPGIVLGFWKNEPDDPLIVPKRLCSVL